LNDIAGKALSREANSGHRIRIEGHTDTVGSAAFNMALSKARANAVAAYLSETYHIDPAALDVAGVGKTKQIVPTPDQTPDQSNRVVLFYAE
jgi:outer membrane protein OmpA-like peptidoglycan-associated protein